MPDQQNVQEITDISKQVLALMDDPNFSFTEEVLVLNSKKSALLFFRPEKKADHEEKEMVLWANATEENLQEWARYCQENGYLPSRYSICVKHGTYKEFLDMAFDKHYECLILLQENMRC